MQEITSPAWQKLEKYYKTNVTQLRIIFSKSRILQFSKFLNDVLSVSVLIILSLLKYLQTKTKKSKPLDLQKQKYMSISNLF